VFNISGFAIYIKINGMILVKNYVHNRLNLRLQVGFNFVYSSSLMKNFKLVKKGL